MVETLWPRAEGVAKGNTGQAGLRAAIVAVFAWFPLAKDAMCQDSRDSKHWTPCTREPMFPFSTACLAYVKGLCSRNARHYRRGGQAVFSPVLQPILPALENEPRGR